MNKPLETEYTPYYKTYISLVPDAGIIKTLEEQLDLITRFFESITEDKAGYRYAEGKWTVREVLGHMADTERIFAYRALRISRNDKTPLPGFDENEYVKNSDFDRQTVHDLLDHFIWIRRSTIALFRTMDEERSMQTGTANGNTISVRAIAYVIAGHASHHMNIIKERYLSSSKVNI